MGQSVECLTFDQIPHCRLGATKSSDALHGRCTSVANIRAKIADLDVGHAKPTEISLAILVGLGTPRRRNEARWRNEEGGAIGIAGATALHLFFWRQVPQFDHWFLPGWFLLRHLDRFLDVGALGPSHKGLAIAL
jgi:hypothetical protein